ncbi:MAG: hypothetical protein PHG42_08205 [Bacteroides sp.]|nr:hypothetical protein [Fermentimonas sp.]MDD4055754.1 hypothetical protein [Bacteroides sp.]MDD4804321.1 hypothetical protein [Candidatus Paceibacterota bacterium]
MLHKPKVRLVVQDKNEPYNKYYPTVLSASASYSYPFTIPTANIEIITNRTPETSGYISPLKVDDIVRLQVSITFSRNEKTVWLDVFEGRINAISSPFGDRNTTTLDCVGHAYETTYTLLEKNYYFNGSIDAVSMLDYIINTDGYLDRITYTRDVNKTHYGVILNEYTLKKDQRYFHDLISDMEKIGEHQYYAGVKTVYNSSGTLTQVFLTWLKFTDAVTTKYRIIEGSHRLLDASFESTSEDLWNCVRIYGDTWQEKTTLNGEPITIDHQYTGISYDTAAMNSYGRRMKVETVTGITKGEQCAQLATGVMQASKAPYVIGEVTIFGTAYARVGDLVYVRIPSLEIDGASIDGNYRVVKVTHSISQNTFTTKLQFGKLKNDVSDYISLTKRQTRINNCNHIKYPS